MMLTYADTTNADVAVRLSLLTQKHRVEMREEVWNRESMRYEIRRRAYYDSMISGSPAMQRRIRFIKTMLPTLKLVSR